MGARRVPCALAVGGIDPGGGAGLAADLRAFAAAGVFGCAAAAVVTVQSTAGLRSVRALPAKEVAAQALEVLEHQDVRAMKLGALGSAENVRAVGQILRRFERIPAVIDTPIRPTTFAGGQGPSPRTKGRLLARGAVAALRSELLPHAALLTVNADEAGLLLGAPVRTVADAWNAARALLASGPRAVIVKGGHLEGRDAVDVLADVRGVIELRARRVAGGPFHGTGCTFASLVAGRIAARSGRTLTRKGLVDAVRWAKAVHGKALARAASVGEGARVLVFSG